MTSATTKKKSRSSIGAPAQHTQPSRKGKKAWRKHVSLEDVEEGLDHMRAEEREIGKPLQKFDDAELFQVDVKGDDTIRKSLPRFSPSQLTSAKILAQRSAVPAVFSRTTTVKRKKLTSEEKDRLVRITKKHRRGPLNSIIDSTNADGRATIEVSEAVKQSGRYDVWAEPEAIEIPDGLETTHPTGVHTPKHPHPKDAIELPAIVEPHQGTSYNPPMQAHQELLLKAHEVEEKRIKEAQLLEQIKEKMKRARIDEEVEEGLAAPGMKVDEGDAEADEEADTNEMVPPRKMPARKTKQQRQKAAKRLADQRALAEAAARKRLLNTVNSAKSLRRATEKTMEASQRAAAARRALLKEKLKNGLAGQRLGKHLVPEGEIVVQLGEDLSESLRGLKPEGNLFRDRFLSLQHRGLVEPRALVLHGNRRSRTKEYEKHAYKRFDRQ